MYEVQRVKALQAHGVLGKNFAPRVFANLRLKLS